MNTTGSEKRCGPGRPKKEPATRRDYALVCCAAASLRDRTLARAAREEVTVSDLIRRALERFLAE
ncbi:MAG TPA: hypothetical protein VLC07_08820 [Solirubrobacterales bacterium]|nr:hypothetical protein [Solirubrobacterales bacterium]